MNDRTHTALRLGAIALLAAACLWPRARAHGSASAAAAARTGVPRVEVTVARAAHAAPRTLKLDAVEPEARNLSN